MLWNMLIVMLLSTVLINAQNINLTIPLNNKLPIGNTEIFGNFITLNQSSILQIDFDQVNPSISFIILQAHTHIYNVSVYNGSCTHTSCVNGTNIGLYGEVKPNPEVFFVRNPNERSILVYISVHVYNRQAPIPGGCNMEFPIPVTPFIHITYNRDYIFVDVAPAREPLDKKCNSVGNVSIDFYRMYLPARDFTEDMYFNAIRGMMTLNKIAENGELIPSTSSNWNVRRMLSAYPGTGAVYVVIAQYNTGKPGYSVYIPSLTYACSPLDGNDCEIQELLANDFVAQMLCAFMVFIGLFVCYFGHRFFKTEMFLTGFFCGIIMTYIIVCMNTNLSVPALVIASTMSGLFFGAIWLTFWWFYGIPLYSVMLTNVTFGFLTAAIFYYVLPGDIYILQPDISFWVLFISIMLIVAFSLASVTYLSNILCCAVLGAYITIYPIDFYLGSHFKYIIINTIRRATVPKFNKAVISPPFGHTDILLIFIWIVLAITGFLYQHYTNRGRPPFPPPPRSSIAPTVPENTYGAARTLTRRRHRGRNGVNVSTNDAVSTSTDRTPLIA